MLVKSLMRLISCLALLIHDPLSASAEPVQVMSYNLRYGLANDGVNHWKFRRNKVISIIRQAEPDVFGVQEALYFQIQDLLAALPDYAMVGEGREGKSKGEFTAVFYHKRRMSVINDKTFWLSDTTNVPSASWGNIYCRIATQVHLKKIMSQ